MSVEQLAPFAKRLQLSNPKITQEILSAVTHLDLTRGEADLAIRTRKPNEPELIAVHESSSATGVFASALYANTLNQPCDWADLDWITWSDSLKEVPPRPMLEKLIPNFKPAFASDDYLVQKAAAVAGMGALIMGYPAMQSPEKSGLVEIDIGITLPDNKFYIVCAKSMQYVPRVAVTAGELIAYLARLKSESSVTPLP